MIIRFKIEGKVGKKPQFIEKDFKDLEAAEQYAEKYCKNWKKIKMKEV